MNNKAYADYDTSILVKVNGSLCEFDVHITGYADNYYHYAGSRFDPPCTDYDVHLENVEINFEDMEIEEAEKPLWEKAIREKAEEELQNYDFEW